MPNLFLVMLGGAIGAGARHLTGRATLALWGPGYPWGTLAVNLIGGLLMGVLAGSLARFGQGGEQWRLLLGVGVLGGFTTFSAFSLDLMVMLERGDWGTALGYALFSVIGALAALALGLNLMRALA
ncbi:fluoride efflux transporter CrcB [Sphingomonas sp. dw_22]|uniref:fluoride efflux transporter CrcB n=1 Tax=Sphingomonas sp. dw_22 TaxID=2721175 RepID=UPI001BD3BD4A|nr:fluoride efflux transporter CrcB [Sphingomonas sp. dw_22]